MRGRFITFEGGEGTGKSTHSTLLADRLGSVGIGVVRTREPGGSPGAEVIRHVLLSGVAKPLGTEAEAMLFAAARGDHVRNTIEPALAQGMWVISDRGLRLGGIDRDAAAGVGGCDLAIGFTQNLVERARFRLEPVGHPLAAPLAGPRQANLRRHVENEGEIGLEVTNGHPFKGADE